MTLLSSSKNDVKRAANMFAADEESNTVPVDPNAPPQPGAPTATGAPDPQEPGGLFPSELDELGELSAEPAPIQGKLLSTQELLALNASDEGRKFVNLAETWYEDCQNSMSERRRQWRMHEAFERGRQHIFYDKKKETIADLPRPKGVPRATVNKMRGIMRTEVAKFTAQKPTAEALPASNDAEDIAAAAAAKQ